jgi:hypothetical protein
LMTTHYSQSEIHAFSTKTRSSYDEINGTTRHTSQMQHTSSHNNARFSSSLLIAPGIRTINFLFYI